MPMSLLIPLVAAITLLAIALLIWALRGRRVDDHPLCRRCRYDLCGTASLPTVCPECGRALTKPRSVRIGHRRKRWVTVAIAVLMLAASVGVGGLVSWQKGKDYDWNRAKPVWWLKRDASGDDPARVQTALTEMLRRVNEKTLWSGQVEDLVDLALVAQGDTTTPWMAEWGEIIEQAWTQGHVTDAQLARYLRQMVEDAYTLRTRNRVRQGTGLPYQLRRNGFRCARRSIFRMLLIRGPIEFAGQTGAGGNGLFRPSPSGGGGSGRTMKVEAEPGEYEFQMTLRALLMTPEEGEALAGKRAPGSNRRDVDAAKTLAEFTTTLVQNVEVAPPDVPVVELVEDEELTDAVHASIISPGARIRLDWSAMYDVTVDMKITARPPIDVAFDIFLRGYENGSPIGSLAAPDAAPSHRRGGSLSVYDLPELHPGVTRIDLTLRPSTLLAERQYGGFERIWGGDILIDDVPVHWVDVHSGGIENIAAEASKITLDQLINDASDDDAVGAQVALSRLAALLTTRSLSRDTIDRLVERALQMQESTEHEWTGYWGDLVELAFIGGHVTDKQIQRYLRNAIDGSLQARIRSPVHAGGEFPVEIRFESPHAAWYGTFGAGFRIDDIEIGGEPARLGSSRGSSGSTSYLRPSTHHRSHMSIVAPTEAGTYPVRVRIHLGVGDHGAWDHRRARSAPPEDWPPLVAQWTREFELQLEVRAADAEIVRLNRDDRIGSQLREALQVDRFVVEKQSRRLSVPHPISIPPLPVDVYCTLLLRDGDRERILRRVRAPMEHETPLDLYLLESFELNAIPQLVDLVLRPDVSLAERTIGVAEIWGEEIVIEGIPVEIIDDQ